MTSELATLPLWAPPATPAPSIKGIGLNMNGDLYLYGETPDSPGPTVPSILGILRSIEVVQLGGKGAYPARDYLRLLLATPLPGEMLQLQLPCNERPRRSGPDAGKLQLPTHVTSLLSRLQRLDRIDAAVKLQTRQQSRRGIFFSVFPLDTQGQEMPEIQVPWSPATRNDLEIAVNGLRSALGLPIQFPSHDIEP